MGVNKAAMKSPHFLLKILALVSLYTLRLLNIIYMILIFELMWDIANHVHIVQLLTGIYNNNPRLGSSYASTAHRY